LGAADARNAEDDGLVPADFCQAGRCECQDAAELGAREAAAFGAGSCSTDSPGGGSWGGVEGGAVKNYAESPGDWDRSKSAICRAIGDRVLYSEG
jgi:hypothetical protein